MSYNAGNQVTWVQAAAPAGFTYDAAGNVLQDNVNNYLYDAEGRLCAVQNRMVGAATGYIYDAEGTRVAKGTLASFSCGATITVTNTYVIGPGGEQLTETDGNGNWIHTNVYAAGQLIATYTQSSSTQPLYFQLADWLGTKRVQTDYQGNNPEYCTSVAFGDNLVCSGTTDATEHHFTGKERDTESGNDYFGAQVLRIGQWAGSCRRTGAPKLSLCRTQSWTIRRASICMRMCRIIHWLELMPTDTSTGRRYGRA